MTGLSAPLPNTAGGRFFFEGAAAPRAQGVHT